MKLAMPPTSSVIGKSESKFMININDPITPTIIVATPITLSVFQILFSIVIIPPKSKSVLTGANAQKTQTASR